MVKHILTIVSFFLFLSNAFSQNDGEKLLNDAEELLKPFFVSKENLEKAYKKVNDAFLKPDTDKKTEAWLLKGNVNNLLGEQENIEAIIKGIQVYPFSDRNYMQVALDAYVKAGKMSTGKPSLTEALEGIESNGKMFANAVNLAVTFFQNKALSRSYLYFKTYLESVLFQEANNIKKSEAEKKDLLTTVVAFGHVTEKTEKLKEANPLFEQLHKAGFSSEEFYPFLVKAKLETGEAATAEKLLKEGRQKYPENSELLFAEINFFIQEKRYNELISSLKKGIAAEPSNASLYFTLGLVYDNLSQDAEKKNDKQKQKEYFDDAKNYYTQAIAKDPKNTDALYSLGSIYYNKAAQISTEIGKPGITELKKKELQTNVLNLFNEALPWFQKAESVDPNDLNTLIALFSIYSFKSDPLAGEFKKRGENIQGGGKNTSSYFKQ